MSEDTILNAHTVTHYDSFAREIKQETAYDFEELLSVLNWKHLPITSTGNVSQFTTDAGLDIFNYKRGAYSSFIDVRYAMASTNGIDENPYYRIFLCVFNGGDMNMNYDRTDSYLVHNIKKD